MNFLKYFMQLLPALITCAAKVGTDLSGAQKKQAVTDILTGIATAVGAVSPYGAAAGIAAASAATAIDGVHALLKEIGVIKPSPAPASP